MTREHAKQLLPIITAYANGENIQIMDGDIKGMWHDLPYADFNRSRPEYYRIKPTPAEYWIYGATAHATDIAAGHAQDLDIRRGLKGGRIIHVIEVEE